MNKACMLLVVAVLLMAPMRESDAAPEAKSQIWMEIPEASLRVDGNGSAELTNPEIGHFVIHINRQTNQISYGSILGKINTESANIVMTTTSTPEGIVCNFDLSHYAGFKLHRGRNSVEMSFTDPFNRPHYASFLLQVPEKPGKGAPLKKVAAPPEKITGEKYAVVVGVSRYKYAGAGLSNLRFADRDASAFRDFLLSPDGGSFPRENILFLVNEDATAENLRSALFTFLTRPRPQDLVVIYFAGHGAPDPNDQRNLYLLTYDTRPENMGGTAFLMSQLQDVFRLILKAKRVVTFTDSCHSFGVSGARYGVPQQGNNLVNQYMQQYAKGEERAVMTASDVSQLSFESDKWGGGHGVFTHYLLQGLGGAADANQDGTVTAGELFTYIHDRVAQETGNQQTPVALPGLAENLPLAGIAIRGGTKKAAASTTGLGKSGSF
jgi:hypothetical protein